MEKKSKETLRRYKKARPASSSDSSSSSDSDSSSSDSYSSSSSKKKSSHRKKKIHASRRSSSSSDDDKVRKREKQHACQKKLEAKRNHLKRKLKETKAKKRAISPSLRRRSVTPPHKAKKLVEFSEKKHHQLGTKERMLREKEREKLRLRDRERGRSRSPKSTKIRIHQEVSSKSPSSRHQIPLREKIIIQARRDHSSSDRKRELKVHHDSRERERRRERAEREAARNKEREEALARCQERQRERERLAREKLRREKEKDYERSAVDRLLPRPAEREMAIAVARGYESRERSLEVDPRAIMHGRSTRVLREAGYDREREFLTEMELRGERDERREHERDFVVVRRRDVSPSEARYMEKLRERELFTEEERYKRPYEIPEEELRGRERNWEHDIRREHEHSKIYPIERTAVGIPPGRDWKAGGPEEWEHWQEKGWPRGKKMAPTPETEWEPNEKYPSAGGVKWDEALRNKHDHARGEGSILQPAHGPGSRRWPQEWRGNHPPPNESLPHTPAAQRHPTAQQINFRHNQLPTNQPMDFNPDRANYRHRHPHPLPLPLLQHGPTGPVNFHPRPLFPSKRQMTYTNPNLIKNKVGIPTPVPNSSSHIPPLLPGLTANPPIKAPSDGAPPTVDKEAAMHISPVVKTHLAVPKEATITSVVKKPDEQIPTLPVVEEPPSDTPVENKESSSVQVVKDTEESEVKGEVEKEDPVPDDLSEISDGDDDILDKVEDKSQPTISNDIEMKAETATDTQSVVENSSNLPTPMEVDEIIKDEDPIVAAIVNDDVTKSEANEDDLLDFEEISDGEFEEETKTKGVGDALGVDWESLVADAKIPYNPIEPTTAKQKWQPHRIIMDIGISKIMAGEEFARQILQEAQEKLDEENCKPKIKQEIKDECDEDDNDLENDCKNGLQFELLHSLACVQVGQRKQREDRLNLIFNAYGDKSRALSARQDLRLRRKLCGLPVKEIDYAQPVSDHLKSLALKMFQKAIETK